MLKAENFSFLNNIGGWFVCIIAAIVYFMTIEPTVSFWDCGEYIATSYRLEVGHPPGAPLFMMIGRVFSAMVSPEEAGRAINMLSATCSAVTILFLFWSITYIARKYIGKTAETLTPANIVAILGSGLVGSLAFTFSDSFWFSAGEGEVYAMSAMFTAVTIWALFKWDEQADEPHSDRWLVLIAYLIGLSIGVHLLNLLCIPAVGFVYYFRKWEKPTTVGILVTGVISVLVLGLVQNAIIPGIVYLSFLFEYFFVNDIGMPFNSGSIIYAVFLIGLVIGGLYWAHKAIKPKMATAILSFAVLVIGYCSFGMILVRSAADPPMDQNDPENAIRLLSYLNREQYGSWPLLYGQYWNTPVIDYEDGTPVYYKNEELGEYSIADERKNSVPVYDPEFMTMFPRMWRTEPAKVEAYKSWSNYVGTPIPRMDPRTGQTTLLNKPTFGENMKFFFKYQFNWMYWRYFMWNFVGRQNDTQGHGGPLDGNWVSGINFIDEARLGPQDKPEVLQRNKGNNEYYFLPFLLGLLGFVFMMERDYKWGLVVFLLWLMTGIAIIAFLNQGPLEPRERDYAFAGSFYAFAIMIGLGVTALYYYLRKVFEKQKMVGAIGVTVVMLFAVPGIMAKENWDDHDRSGRYTARDMAKNYLDACAPDAILFSMGDNDTFPLWYVQEVEGYRTDVRVVNLSYLGIDWYIEQMQRKVYKSERLPLTLKIDQYRQGTRDFIPIIPKSPYQGNNVRVDQLLQYVLDEDKKEMMGNNELMNILPTRGFKIPITDQDKQRIIQNGVVKPEDAGKIVNSLEWKLRGGKRFLSKADLVMMDILAHFNWERPVYFTTTIGRDGYFGLEEYFRLEGFAYRLVPIYNKKTELTGSVDTDILYENLMEKFQWGGIEDPDIFLDHTNTRLLGNIRLYFAQLAEALEKEGDTQRAIAVVDRIFEKLPGSTVEHNYVSNRLVALYYRLGEKEKADKIIKEMYEEYFTKVEYYLSFETADIRRFKDKMQYEMSILNNLMDTTKDYVDADYGVSVKDRFDKSNALYVQKMTEIAQLEAVPQY